MTEEDYQIYNKLFQVSIAAVAKYDGNIPQPVRTFVFNIDGDGEYNKCLTTSYFTYGRWIGFKLAYYFAEKTLWICENKYYFR